MKLCSGVGDKETRGCWMAAITVYAGEDWSDHPACVPPTIRRMCIALNDMLGSDEKRERIIGPYLFLPVGADPSPEAERQRAFMAADAAVRVFAADALESAGLEAEALKLRNLKPVVDEDSAREAEAAACEAACAVEAKVYVAAHRSAAAAAYAASGATYAEDCAAAYAANAAPEALLQLIIDCCRVGQPEPVDAERVEQTKQELAHWG